MVAIENVVFRSDFAEASRTLDASVVIVCAIFAYDLYNFTLQWVQQKSAKGALEHILTLLCLVSGSCLGHHFS